MRAGWPVVMACFVTAVIGWGFGLYGQSVYVADLHATRGWSTALVSSASTVTYLAGAGMIVFTPRVAELLGPRIMLIAGAVIISAGAAIEALASAPWQVFLGAVVVAWGWGWTSITAIATTLAQWFDARRGLAISLALNGASVGGFTVAPLLVMLAPSVGLGVAVPAVAAGLLALQVPMVLWATGRPRATPASVSRTVVSDGRLEVHTRAAALRTARFWHVCAPFALALMAQVAMLVHLVAYEIPLLGAAEAGVAIGLVSAMAVVGRLTMGALLARLDLRFAAAASILSQAAGIMLMWAMPETDWAQYLGCVVFGLSVGNVITLPSLIVQREFAAASFGLVVGLSTAVGQVAYAFAPGLAGVVHDVTRGYSAVLLLCVAFQVAASVSVVLGRRSSSNPR